jgi:hypothetical protein
MEKELFTRDTPEEKGARDTGGRTKSYAEKLKNKDSAKKYYGRKLRKEREKRNLSPEEEQKRKQARKKANNSAQKIQRKEKAKDLARNVAYGGAVIAGRAVSAENDMDDSATEDIIEAGGYVSTRSSGRARSKGKPSQYSGKLHGKRAAEGEQELTAKEKLKKDLKRKAVAESQSKATENMGKIGRKITDKAEDAVGMIAEAVQEFAEDNPLLTVIIVLVLLILLMFSGFMSSCGALGSGGGDLTVITTFTAQDADILLVEEDYKELEEELREEIADIETEYPGYDEYNYYLDEIGNNPYQLAAILTVLFEDYRRDEVQEKIREIFELQYELTTEEVVEIRQREVEKTDIRWVEDDSYALGGYFEEYTYTETEDYEYYILNIYLVNHGLDAVVEELGFSDDELARYEVLLETYGNKPYLFGEDDIYSIPRPREGDYDDYDVPREYLSDERFARMLAEAERHLGTPYVWGGYDPSGFDCSGFVSWVINHCGNGWNYGRQTANGLRAITSYVPSSEAMPGDLVFFHGTYDVPGASHVGIYVGNGMMIHAGNPVHYSSINTSYWQSHFLEFGRLP